ncbi:hypothetical protein ES708_02195 [subsurface metagenome]
MIKIKETKLEDFKALTIKNKKISLTIIPELGGKIISIINRETGFDFIWRNKTIKLQKFSYDSNFAFSDSSGINECFPTIFPCKYICFPWENIMIPDHGEIWPLSFKTVVKENKIIQDVHGVRFPYIFTRVIGINNNTIKLSYKVENLSQFKFNFIWAIHPIFKLLDHNCGKIMDLVESYIVVGPKMVESFSPPPLGDGNLAEAKSRSKGKFIIVGNVDQVNVLKPGPIDKIKKVTEKTVEVGKVRGKFILQSADFLEYETPLKNLETYIKAGIEYGDS